MKLKIPEKRLLEIGFRILDSMYGELTVKKSYYWDIIFVDNDNVARLGYDKPGSEKPSLMSFLDKDMDYFLNVIPVEISDYETVLKAWVEERHKRRVDIAGPHAFPLK